MVIGSKLESLEKLNKLFSLARKGDDDFAEHICNYISNEYDLQAVVLFKTLEDNNLQVLGKSANARKNYLKGSFFRCSICTLINEKSGFNVHSDSNCELQISEFLVYESCITFAISEKERGFLKIAKKSAFTQSDKDVLTNIVDFLSFLLQIWMNAKGGNLVVHETSFNNVVYDTAQEMRTPANTIIGFTSILAEDNLTSSQAEYVSTIKKNAQNLLLSINDLFETAKLENGTIQNNVKTVDPRVLIGETIELFRNKPGSANTRFVNNVDPSVPAKILVDDQKLRYMLNTILLTSSTLSQNGEVVIHTFFSAPGNLRFEVFDNGRSLTPEQNAAIFNPFGISKIPELKNSNLTGLSLTLVKRIIDQFGGFITAAPGLNKGTLFTFNVFCEAEQHSDATKRIIESQLSALPKPAAAKKNRVLVIEDDYATSKLLSNYLNKWGYDPIIVSTMEQIFSMVEKETFLAIILDIELPNINGLELLRKIHEHPSAKSVPVIVCSVETEQQKAFIMGAVEYFQKPINYNYLVEVLTNYKLRKNSTILCVDDDFPTLNLVKQAIESVGFNALAENVSANVMDLIRNRDVDLAIVDLDMPYPNGFELIKLIKQEPKFANLPIIIYTGKENYAEDLKSIDGMFDELLSKRSTNIEDLADTINAMINRYETPSQVQEVIAKHNVIKILLAEDYKHSQIIVTRLLKKNTFENVVVVENGEAALELAKQEKFDLILMDMQMPVMNGFEATEKIRLLPEYKDVPIIALTAFAMKGDREKCLEAGATDYIPKPIDSKEFLEKVKYYTSKLS
jgi:CheY-like chemotaxis protein